MKQTTRDNIIYLAVGVSLAALLAFDVFYSDSHNRRMWMPSRFAFRAVATTGLMIYCVLKYGPKLSTQPFKTVACTALALILHLATIFNFRQMIDQLSGLAFSALAPWEMFFVWLLSKKMTALLPEPRRPG